MKFPKCGLGLLFVSAVDALHRTAYYSLNSHKAPRGLDIIRGEPTSSYSFKHPDHRVPSEARVPPSKCRRQLLWSLLACLVSPSQPALSLNLRNSRCDRKIIDAHVHIWSDGSPNAPPSLAATPDILLRTMRNAGISGALIVQPINYKYDHSYVKQAINTFPDYFKAICLADPTVSVSAAATQLETLHFDGFVGVRFNPSLWPTGERMSNLIGSILYEKAGELGMPVGFMCFKGLGTYLLDVEALVTKHPKTKCIIDHLGFIYQDGSVEEGSWDALLSLAKYSQIYVKVSGLFRNSAEPFPYIDLKRRVQVLVDVFGCDHLLFGSDFPFVVEHGGYAQNTAVICDWELSLDDKELERVLHGTTEELFGEWGGDRLSR